MKSRLLTAILLCGVSALAIPGLAQEATTKVSLPRSLPEEQGVNSVKLLEFIEKGERRVGRTEVGAARDVSGARPHFNCRLVRSELRS